MQEDDHHEEALAALGEGYAGLFKKRTGADKRESFFGCLIESRVLLCIHASMHACMHECLGV